MHFDRDLDNEGNDAPDEKRCACSCHFGESNREAPSHAQSSEVGEPRGAVLRREGSPTEYLTQYLPPSIAKVS